MAKVGDKVLINDDVYPTLYPRTVTLKDIASEANAIAPTLFLVEPATIPPLFEDEFTVDESF